MLLHLTAEYYSPGLGDVLYSRAVLLKAGTLPRAHILAPVVERDSLHLEFHKILFFVYNFFFFELIMALASV